MVKKLNRKKWNRHFTMAHSTQEKQLSQCVCVCV